ncbi:DUF4352 domain-containing protein [Candidatus Dojkabacteria bacterium]|uniref:DUF4352 domain-containing protein n=1 Tax=Candidatus Dojkabacteria bacterium TaxID=2099670 RepID=A0A847EUR0_9BACT|nr:DUF4352 domain-containing protein [Candidatus Dojkabacteria bacterium]
MAKTKKGAKTEIKHHSLFFPIVGTLLILISLVSIYLFLFTPIGIIRDTNSPSSPEQNNEKTTQNNRDTGIKENKTQIYPNIEVKKPEVLIYKIGEIVKFNNANVKVENVVSGTKIEGSEKWSSPCTTETGVLVKVRIYYKNTGNKSAYVSNFILYDSKDREFEAESMPFCIENRIVFTEKLNPGLELTFQSLYEIPKDAVDLKIRLSENIYISLGF